MKYLFLDTNIFIHYKSFEDIPWKSLINTTDDITISLASIVLREIDKHKDSSKSRIKEKARKLSKKINNILIQHQQSRIPLMYCRETPITEKEKEIFDISVNDDRFILNVLHSSKKMEDVYVVSNDTDLILKAQDAGINVLYMDETYRSADEPTEEEKELKKVIDELEKLKNRQSNPIVIFEESNSDCLKLSQIHFKAIDEIVDSKIEEATNKYPPKKYIPIENISPHDNMAVAIKAIQEQLRPNIEGAVAKYNEMLDLYLENLRKKEVFQTLSLMRNEAFKKICFIIYNDGTAQTGDMHIQLTFPSHAKIYQIDKSKDTITLDRPIEPVYNENMLGLSSVLKMQDMSYIPSLGFYDNSKYDIKLWNPEKTTSQRIFTMNISRLTHGLQTSFDEDIYINTEEQQKFEIEWKIVDSSLIEPKSGILKIEVSDNINEEL